MKKPLVLTAVVILVLSLVVTLSMVGCKSTSTTTTAAAETTTTAAAETTTTAAATTTAADMLKGKKIGIMLSWGTHEWYVSVMDGFKKRADELGIKYNLVDSEGKVDKGVSIIENFVQEGVDGILLFPGSPTGYEAGISAATKANIPVLDDVIDMPGAGLTGYAGNPQFAMTRATGKACGEYIKKNWPADKEVNVLTVNIPAFPNLNGRTDGFLIGLLEAGVNFNWKAEVDGQGNLTTALDVSTNALTAHPEINLCFGINDDSMFGAYKAAEQLGMKMDDMIFVGTGLEGPKARNSLISGGPHKFDTSMFPATQGYMYVNLFAELFKGNKIEYRTIFPYAATSKDNFSDYYNKDLSENSAVISKIVAEDSQYPITVGWDRNWYEAYKKDQAKFKEQYKY